jgi:translation initiation factor 3 subunit F
LIQNFYANEVAPQRAIHVILDPGVEGDEEPGVKAYIRFVTQNFNDIGRY